MQAVTRTVTAPLGPYVHVQTMLAATLLLKCLTVTYFRQSEMNAKLKTVLSGIVKKYHTETFLAIERC